MQSATDDPEFVSPLLPRDIRFSTNEGFVLYANVQKVLNVRVRRCVCVCGGGGNVLASGERGFQE